MTARGIRAGRAYIEIYADNNKLRRGLKLARRRLEGFRRVVMRTGKDLAQIGTTMAIPLAISGKAFADFEQQLANVSTMLAEPQKYMAQFSRELKIMAVQFGEGTETLSKGLYDILSASIPAGDALGVLAVSTKAAKAGLTDTGTSADAITTILNSYALSAKEAASVSDLLFTVVKRGKLTFADLAPNIGNVASVAYTAGLSLEEMGAALAVLTRNGIKTEESVTALRAILSTFLKPTAESAAAARELGFELNSTTLRAVGLAGVLKRLQNLPPDAIARLFPNIRALKGVLPLIKDLQGLTADTASMAQRAGTTEVAYAKMTNTLTHAFNQTKQSVIVALTSIGEAMAGTAKRMMKGVRDIAGAIAAWAKANQGIVVGVLIATVTIGGLAAALITAGVFMKAFTMIIGAMATTVTIATATFAALKLMILAVLSSLGLAVVAIVGVTTAIAWMGNKGGRAIQDLGKDFGTLGDDVDQAMEGIGKAMAAGNIAQAAKILWLTLKMEWQRGLHALRRLWASFAAGITTAITGAFYGALGFLESAWAGLRKGWAATVNFLSKTWSKFTSGIKTGWNEANGWIQKRFIDLLAVFDDSFSAEAAKKLTDQKTAEANQAIASSLTQSLAEADAQYNDRKKAINDERDRVLQELDRQFKAKDSAMRQQYEMELAENRVALEKARAEWKKALAAAGSTVPGRGRGEGQGGPGGEGPGIGLPDLSRAGKALETLTGKLPGIRVALDNTARSVSRMETVGAFNVAAAAGFGASSSADRTARATEQTAKNTKDILSQARSGGLVFG